MVSARPETIWLARSVMTRKAWIAAVSALERVPRVLEPADQEGDEEDGERVVAGERGDDDPGVAVVLPLEPVRVGVERVAEVAVLARAPEAGDRARDRHHGEDLPPRPHAGVPRRARGVTEHLRLEAEARPRVEHPQHRRREHGEPGAERQEDSAAHVER